jgi:hypothetical protein
MCLMNHDMWLSACVSILCRLLSVTASDWCGMGQGYWDVLQPPSVVHVVCQCKHQDGTVSVGQLREFASVVERQCLQQQRQQRQQQQQQQQPVDQQELSDRGSRAEPHEQQTGTVPVIPLRRLLCCDCACVLCASVLGVFASTSHFSREAMRYVTVSRDPSCRRSSCCSVLILNSFSSSPASHLILILLAHPHLTSSFLPLPSSVLLLLLGMLQLLSTVCIAW